MDTLLQYLTKDGAGLDRAGVFRTRAIRRGPRSIAIAIDPSQPGCPFGIDVAGAPLQTRHSVRGMLAAARDAGIPLPPALLRQAVAVRLGLLIAASGRPWLDGEPLAAARAELAAAPPPAGPPPDGESFDAYVLGAPGSRKALAAFLGGHPDLPRAPQPGGAPRSACAWVIIALRGPSQLIAPPAFDSREALLAWLDESPSLPRGTEAVRIGRFMLDDGLRAASLTSYGIINDANREGADPDDVDEWVELDRRDESEAERETPRRSDDPFPRGGTPLTMREAMSYCGCVPLGIVFHIMPESVTSKSQRALMDHYTFKGRLAIGGNRTTVRVYGCFVASMPNGVSWSARQAHDWEEAYGSLAERALPLTPWTPPHVLAGLRHDARAYPSQVMSFVSRSGGLIGRDGQLHTSHQLAAHARFHDELPQWNPIFEIVFARYAAQASFASWQHVQDADMGLQLHLSLHELMLAAAEMAQRRDGVSGAGGEDPMKVFWIARRMLREQESVLRAALKDPVLTAAPSYREQYRSWLDIYQEFNRNQTTFWSARGHDEAEKVPVIHSPFITPEGYPESAQDTNRQIAQQCSLGAWLARRCVMQNDRSPLPADRIVALDGAADDRTYYLDWYSDEMQDTPVLRERTLDWEPGRILAALPLEPLLHGMSLEIRGTRGAPLRLHVRVDGMPPGFDDRVKPVLPSPDLLDAAVAWFNEDDKATPAQGLEAAWYTRFRAAIMLYESAAAEARAAGIPPEFRTGDDVPDGWLAARMADAEGWRLGFLLDLARNAAVEHGNPTILIDYALAARNAGATAAQRAFDMAVECHFLSPEVTNRGRQCASMSSVDGTIHPIEIDPVRLGSHSAAVWSRKARALGVDEHLIADGGDIPAEPCGPYRSAPDAEQLREVRELTASLIDEAIDHRAWTIPPSALVEIELGRFRWVQLLEQPPMILARLRDTLGHYVNVRLNTEQRSWILYDRLSPDPREEAMILLGLAAVIRDFLVVDKSETGFRAERRRGQARWQHPDPSGYICVYLPRRQDRGARHGADAIRPENLKEGLERWRAGRRGGPVSGHVRRLPEGWAASDEQVMLSRIYGFDVPDGHTFVTPHERGDAAPKLFHRSRSAVSALLGAGFDTGIPSDDPWWTFEAGVRDALAEAGLEVLRWAPAAGRPGCLRIIARRIGSEADVAVVHAALPGGARPAADRLALLRDDVDHFATAHPKLRAHGRWIGGLAGPGGIEIAMTGPV